MMDDTLVARHEFDGLHPTVSGQVQIDDVRREHVLALGRYGRFGQLDHIIRFTKLPALNRFRHIRHRGQISRPGALIDPGNNGRNFLITECHVV